jgi:sorbitol-6-phosphate 2-dehydrogenase
MTESDFAPLLRGALIEKTGGPWAAAAAPRTFTGGLTVQAGEPETTAETLRAALRDLAEIPPVLRVSAGGGAEWVFITAPDFDGLEQVRSGKKTGGWEIPSRGAMLNTAGKAGGVQQLIARRAAVVEGRVALVTGGAQGFGEEIVRGLIEAGALVFIADLNLEGARKLASALNGENGKTVAVPAEVNVADEDSVKALFAFIAVSAGGLDLCVSNAGVLRAAPILEQDIPSFKFVTDINYTAFAIITKHCGLLMKAQNLAAPSWITDIIQINSKSGLEGSNKNGAYAGGKFGSIGLVQSFALELVEYRIKVNAVCPGNFYEGPLWADPEKGLFVQYLKTGKVPGAKTVAEVKAYYVEKVPMKRGCSGPDVIRAVLYLVEQIYETGQALPVTGGQVMLN